MSAAATLAGLYQPTEDHIWLKSLPWEPVPIHTQPQQSDSFLAMKKPCPTHGKLVDQLKHNDSSFTNLREDFKKEFEILEKHTGWKNVTIDHFETVYMATYIYSMHNNTFIPAWVNSLDKEKLAYLASMYFASETFTDELKSLKTGPFFENLLNFFNESVASHENPRFLMMSGHDETIASVMNTMDVFDYIPPEFSSMVVWELYESSNGSLFLKVYYKKPSKDDAKALKIPHCKEPCYLNDFSKYFSRFVRNASNWEANCEISSRQCM